VVALCDEQRIGLDELPLAIRQNLRAPTLTLVSEHPLDDAERTALLAVLEEQRWHMTHTAEQLGVSRNTLYRKLRKHGIAR
jgi:transcriptional regulator of acetoin/glycerol metabolism